MVAPKAETELAGGFHFSHLKTPPAPNPTRSPLPPNFLSAVLSTAQHVTKRQLSDFSKNSVESEKQRQGAFFYVYRGIRKNRKKIGQLSNTRRIFVDSLKKRTVEISIKKNIKVEYRRLYEKQKT